MGKMQIAIVDDEQCWRDKIVLEIMSHYNEKNIDVYSSGEEYLKSDKEYDLTFVDVEMGEKDGFDTIMEARRLGKKGCFVILTVHKECASRGYIVNAYRYIDKFDIQDGMEELFASLHSIMANSKAVEIPSTRGKKVKIKIGDIIYVETNSYYVTIHTVEGVIHSRIRLADLEKMIEEDRIFRCHNSYIVNLSKVKSFDNHFAYMINNEKVEVSKRKYSEFKKMYMKIKFSQANF